MENSKGHEKLWKMMIMSWNFYNCTEQFCKWDDFIYEVKFWTVMWYCWHSFHWFTYWPIFYSL